MNRWRNCLAAMLLMGSCVAAWAQTPTPANPAVAGKPAPQKRVRTDFTVHTQHLLYVALPGSLERPIYPSGSGVVVLDANNHWAFVKRIHVWDYAGSQPPEDISGIAASPATNMLYLSARGRIAAIDLGTDKLLWSTTLDSYCCERPQVDSDGKTLVVGSNLQDYWYKLDARSGKLLAIFHAPESPNAHNLNLSADGKRVFMSPNGPVLSIADEETAKIIRTIRFPDHIRVQVVNKDSSKIYVNQNNFLGYMVANLNTGKILQKVEVTSVDWRPKWFTSPRPHIGHGCPSHGIALVRNGTEIWLDDGIFKKIHIFSNTDTPKEIATIDTPNGSYWLMPGIYGKLVYASSGDIIDVATRKVVGHTKDEYGDLLFSEKELDMLFEDGHLQRVSNQFGNGYGDFVTAEKMGEGPHMPVLPGKAPLIATPTGPDPNANVDWATQ